MHRMKLVALVIFGVGSIGFATPLLVSEVASAQNVVQVCQAGGSCDTFVTKYLNPFIKILTATVGLLAAISIIVAAIQYSSAGGDAGKVHKAKERIGQTLLGLLAYILLFAFISFIIPGGLF